MNELMKKDWVKIGSNGNCQDFCTILRLIRAFILKFSSN